MFEIRENEKVQVLCGGFPVLNEFSSKEEANHQVMLWEAIQNEREWPDFSREELEKLSMIPKFSMLKGRDEKWYPRDVR